MGELESRTLDKLLMEKAGPSSFAESTPIEKKKPKKKYIKKNVDADFQNFCSRNFDKVSDEHPELKEKDINKHLQSLWNHMDDTAKSRYKARKGCCTLEQEENESLEETSEELEEDPEIDLQSSKSSNEAELQSSKSNSPPPSVGVAQKPAPAKRNCKNLFSGVKNEKVCQICEKAGDTVRCRGPCQGFYHPSCVTNPPAMTSSTPLSTPTSARKGRKGRPKKSLGNSPQVENETFLREEIDQKLVVEPPTDKSLEEELKSEVPIPVEVMEVDGKSSKVRKGSKDSLSGEEEESFRCKDCSQGRTQPCFACHEYVQKKTGEVKLYRCITANCGKVYHEECLKAWPQTSWRGTNRTVLICPQHTCHNCISDNPAVIKARYSNDKLVRCVRCPSSYHYGNHCLPAGTEILTSSQIICPQHYKPPRKGLIHHVNAAWCFICASGGSLICCDLCPTAFHADCLQISTPPDTYVCEDCQTGRFPLYGEVVWVKLGCYRWWPAKILFPFEIPDNILNLPHVRGEFAVRFFGSHDHYWVNRGRVFLYQDGDTAGKSNYKKSSVDNTFEKAVKEASEAQKKWVEEKASREAETRPGMKPPNYVKLKANKPVGNVRTMEMNLSNLTPCECDPKGDNPCAPDSDCLNRILMVECNPQVCPAGEKCCNQLFEKRQYPPLQPYQTQERGWGLKTLVPLKKGDFVIEYVGEMIDEDEYKRRLADMHERNEDNFYFLTIDKDRMLDAGPKGNVARFMNHSCQPNCETQKWTVNGDTRVGLFALSDIPADTELVFNYNLESTGNDKKPCMCGAPNCSGFIGVKAIKQEKEDNKEKKPVKKKKTAKTRERKCFMCWKEGDLLRCDGKHCTKGYHLSCLGKKQAPQGYWLCPWHQCNICNKGRVRRCTLCVNSYCQEHWEGNIHEDPDSKHLLCTKHSQVNPVNGTDLQDTKDSSLLMEVDGNSSDNSTTASSLSSDPSTKEATNNNVLKTTDNPRLRTRRSKSTGAGDIVVNGSVEKVNTRRKRPSSVDEALITSNEKTDSKNKKSFTLKERIFTSDNIVKGIIIDVIDNLPEEKKGDLEKSEKYNKRKKEIFNTSLNENVNKVGALTETEVDDLNQPESESFHNKVDALAEIEGNDLDQPESESLHNKVDALAETEGNDLNQPESESFNNKVDALAETEGNDLDQPESESLNNKVDALAETEGKDLDQPESESLNNKVDVLAETEGNDLDQPESESLHNKRGTLGETEGNDLDQPESELLQQNLELNKPDPESPTQSGVEESNNTAAAEKYEASEKGTLSNNESAKAGKYDFPNESAVDTQDGNKCTVQDAELKTEVQNHLDDESDMSEKIGKEGKNIFANDGIESESHLRTLNGFENSENPTVISESNKKIGNKENLTSISESNGNEISVHDGLVMNEIDENKISATKCLEEPSNKESIGDITNEETTNSKTVVDADDNVDDFELSYSENSNDKLFKSMNNSESSIEMKLTNCGTTEEEAISRKLEEINGPKDLVNGIEQSSVMEVA